MNKSIPSHLLSCPVVFVSTRFEDQCDIMIATAMFVSEAEPLLVVSLNKRHLTSQLIEKSGGFTVIAASEAQRELYQKLTASTEQGKNKFTALSIATLPDRTSKPAIPEGSATWFDCRTVAKEEIDEFNVYIGRVTDHADLGKAPIIWRNQTLFGLKAL